MPEKIDLSWFEEMEARIPKGKVRTRFAPSPTGYMHVGNLRTALYTWRSRGTRTGLLSCALRTRTRGASSRARWM